MENNENRIDRKFSLGKLPSFADGDFIKSHKKFNGENHGFVYNITIWLVILRNFYVLEGKESY